MSPRKRGRESHSFLITFSGIDGAGKSTQIDCLSSYLQNRQLRVVRFSFWDDAAVWPRLRSSLGQSAVRLHCPAEARESFSPKNHKHVRRWYLTAVRSSLYVLDVMRLRYLLASKRARNCDVVIFDRYVYDQVANISSHSPVVRICIQLLLRQAPHPDLAFIIDTPPAEAFARKPEYPLDFVYRNRRAFLQLKEFCPELIRISGGNVEDVQSEILDHLHRSPLGKAAGAGESETANKSAVIGPPNSCREQNQPTEHV
jgi:thymidylate kinase